VCRPGSRYASHLTFALLAVVACKRDPPAPAPESRPAAEAEAELPKGEDDDLIMRATKKGSVYELRAGDGVALLSTSPFSIVAPNAEAGGKFLAAAAKWLKVELPAKTHTQPLEPLSFETIDMDDQNEGGRTWHYHKAFLRRGAEYAELYINIDASGRFVNFRPKDSGYADALADILADALRDGPAPARTKETDPNLESEEPMFTLTKTGVEISRSHPVCLANRWLAASREKVEWRAWSSVEAKQLCKLPGEADQVETGTRSARGVALVSVHPPGVTSTSDRSEVWTLGPDDCKHVTPNEALKLTPFSTLLVSPDAAEAAFENDGDLSILDLGTGKVRHVAGKKGHYLSGYRWDDDGPLLKVLLGTNWIRAGDKPLELDQPVWLSRDKAYRASPSGATVAVTSKSGTATFTAKIRSDVRALKRSLDDAPALLGAHAMVLSGSPDLALDLATLKTRPLTPAGYRYYCSSPDGEHALFLDENDSVFEGALKR
jgi:hypothetical protein